jgi:hypothetical protein
MRRFAAYYLLASFRVYVFSEMPGELDGSVGLDRE